MTTERHGRRAGALAATLLGALLLGAGVIAPRARGPAPPQPDSARFVADAREGTRRYRIQQAAVDDGFTRVGGEFPAMGEHWVSFARVLEDSLVAGQPSILIYVNGSSGPQLAGVAYTRLVTATGTPRAFPFAGAWHEHNGAVTEESRPIGHSAHAPAPAAPDDSAARLFVLHAWVWTSNPEGVFVTDNWGLPFARHELTPPSGWPRDAARALALADDRDGYHREALRSTLALSPREDSLAARVIVQHQKVAAQAARAIGGGRGLATGDLAGLAAVWDSLWAGLHVVLPERGDALGRLRPQM